MRAQNEGQFDQEETTYGPLQDQRLTKAQKRAIVRALMDAAGTLVEFWGEQLGSVPATSGRRFLAHLMRKMPTDCWDDRLGPPDREDDT